MIPLLRDKAQHDHPRQHAGDAGNSQVDQDALGNLPNRDIDHRARETEEWRQDRHEEPRVDAVEQHLEDRVEGNEAGGVLGRPLGDLVPDDHHGDAAGEADHDQADHVLGFVGQEDDRQREHQDRPDDPVLNQRQAKNFPVDEDIGQFLVTDLGERWVHHQDQAQRDRNVGRSDLEGIDPILDARNVEAQADAERHGGEYPDRQIPVGE